MLSLAFLLFKMNLVHKCKPASGNRRHGYLGEIIKQAVKNALRCINPCLDDL